MKAALAILGTLGLVSCSNAPSGGYAESQTTYFGQKPPGDTPELFAPGLVSTDALEALPAISPDLGELYFIRQSASSPALYHFISQQDGEWVTRTLETTAGSGEVFISPDGQTMHLGHEFKERTEDGWSPLKSLGAPFDQYNIMRLTSSESGTYVFDERDEFGLIRYSRVIDGEHEEPRTFGEAINKGTYTAHPFIAPDESYLIFDSVRDEGYGDSDLYISFRLGDGSWGEPINLGAKINSEMEDIFGSVTPDGRYFIFQRIDLSVPLANIYWVDAQTLWDVKGAESQRSNR